MSDEMKFLGELFLFKVFPDLPSPGGGMAFWSGYSEVIFQEKNLGRLLWLHAAIVTEDQMHCGN